MESPTINASEFKKYAKLLIGLKEPFMVKGSVGVGKTSISKQAAQELELNYTKIECKVLIEPPHLKEPTDYTGFPFVIDPKDGTEPIAKFLPLGSLQTIMTATERLHVVFDELDKAPRATMNAVAQLLLQREVSGYQVPDCVSFSATANLRSDKAGSNVFPSHLVDRFTSIFHLVPTLDEWCKQAIREQLPAEFIAFNRFKPGFLTEGLNVDSAKDLQKSATPRTISKFGQLLATGMRDLNFLTSTIGLAYAAEYLAFEQLYKTLPDIEVILANPNAATVPTEPSTMFATVAALTNRADKTNFANVSAYLQRMPIYYSLCAIIDIVAIKPDLQNTRTYIEWFKNNSDVMI